VSFKNLRSYQHSQLLLELINSIINSNTNFMSSLVKKVAK